MNLERSALRPVCKVLLIEDNPSDAELITIAMAKAGARFQVRHVNRLNEGLSAVHDEDWTVILSDLSLPDSHGMEAIRVLRRHAPNIPIVVLTSLTGEENALAALDEGAQDYLSKDSVTSEILQRAVRHAIQRQKNSEMKRLIEDLREHEQLLEKKNRRLEKLYKTAHRFVDNVSHEFRTPLTVIKEYVSLVRDGIVGELNDEQRQMLDVVGDRADDLNNMVDDMLDISKLEAGMLGICRRTCAVADIIQHICPSLQKKSSVKDVALSFDIPDDLPKVYCDDEKIGRVLVNLAINAIKFSGDPGQVTVWAQYRAVEGHVLIGVTDNGAGISKENLQIIFQRFKQVGGNPRGSTKGFGLGLNIAKELVDLNLGEIRVASEQGDGSTFSFTVPVADPIEVVRRYLDKIQNLNNGSSIVTLVRVRTAASANTHEVNRFLNLVLRRNDLLFPINDNEMLLVLPVPAREISKFVDRTEHMRLEANKNRPQGPLPKLETEVVDSWASHENPDKLLSRVEQIFQLAEVSHV